MNDLTKEKKCYEAPLLTVVSFKVEQGYALSLNSLAIASSFDDAQTYGGNDYLEDRTSGGYWGGSDGWI